MLCPHEFSVLWTHRTHVKEALGCRLANGLMLCCSYPIKYVHYRKNLSGIWQRSTSDIPKHPLLSPEDLMNLTFPPIPKKLLTDKGAPKNETYSNPKSSDHETSQVSQ